MASEGFCHGRMEDVRLAPEGVPERPMLSGPDDLGAKLLPAVDGPPAFDGPLPLLADQALLSRLLGGLLRHSGGRELVPRVRPLAADLEGKLLGRGRGGQKEEG